MFLRVEKVLLHIININLSIYYFNNIIDICFTKNVKKCNIFLRIMRKMERSKYFNMLIALAVLLMIVATTLLFLPTVSWLSKTDNTNTNTGTSKVATAGLELYNGNSVLNGSAENIMKVGDISSNYLVTDLDQNSNALSFSGYGSGVYNADWIATTLKPNTSYTISCTLELVDYIELDNLDYTADFCGIEIYNSSDSKSIAMISSTVEALRNGKVTITNSFKALSDITNLSQNYRVAFFAGYKRDTSGTLHYNTVRFHNIYLAESSTAKAGSYTANLGTAGSATSLSLKVKNTGTASGLVRLYYNIKTVDNKTLTSADASVVINSDFIVHEKLDTAHCGYLFYNAAMDPSEIVNIFTSITPTEKMANEMIVIQLSAESVVYAGNAYSAGVTDKYPWSSVPANWFCL